MSSLSDHIPNPYTTLAVNKSGQLEPDLYLQAMAQALEEDFGLSNVAEIVPKVINFADRIYIPELSKIIHTEQCYGEKTRMRALDKMLKTVIEFGAEQNGFLTYDIFAAIHECLNDPKGNKQLMHDKTIGTIVDFVLSRDDALKTVTMYQYHHQRMYGRPAHLRNE